jgi:hypothetical protein
MTDLAEVIPFSKPPAKIVVSHDGTMSLTTQLPAFSCENYPAGS